MPSWGVIFDIKIICIYHIIILVITNIKFIFYTFKYLSNVYNYNIK